MTRLLVTEKERMALNIAKALGSYSRRSLSFSTGWRRRISAYEVEGGQESEPLVILPLSGHIMNYVTRSDLERWSYASVDRILKDPQSLVKVVSRRGYYSAIRSLAEKSSEVVIATDSDEEGENIGLEVIEALGGQMKPVRRLWLTTTVPSDIRSSISRTREFNRNLALSVEARRKIDALVGFAGTRQITLRLRRSLAKSQRSTHSSWGGRSTWWRRRGRRVSSSVLSFGRVQTSTLWIVVQREREIISFVPRAYWDITADVGDGGTRFVHIECPIFDRECAFEIYDRIKDEKEFLCTDVRERSEHFQPPRPLNTAELLRAGSNLLHVSPSRVMSLAEALYLEGKITYPRVDNQVYSRSFDHRVNLAKLAEGTKLGGYARSLLERDLVIPTRGRFSEDHEPITPIAAITAFRDPLGYRLYEVILRHYLSVFGPPAIFLDTSVKGVVKAESFQAVGRKLVESGYYGIYYYPPKENPLGQNFTTDVKYDVKSVGISEKKTTPPPRFKESALLAEMERQGIGTKSTRPLMIDTLRRRAYVQVERQTVVPTERGLKLIENIEKPWGDYISPEFTARVETEMERVARGERDWQDLVESERRAFAQAIERFRAV